MFYTDSFEAIKPSTRGRKKQPAKMEEAISTPGKETGCRILEAATAHLECKVVAHLDVGGNHDVFVGGGFCGFSKGEGDANNTFSLVYLGWSYVG